MQRPMQPRKSSTSSGSSAESAMMSEFLPDQQRADQQPSTDASGDDSMPHDDSDSPYRREFTRYKLDTSTVVERSLENEFLHVLSIIHRYVRVSVCAREPRARQGAAANERARVCPTFVRLARCYV